MGLDLLGCYAPTRNVTLALPDRSTVTACLYRYITRPNWHWDPDLVDLGNWGYVGRMTAMKIAKIEKLWQDIKRPRHCIYVHDNDYLKEHGMKRNETGTLHYSTKSAPPIWLEENEGDIGVGQARRLSATLWVVDRFDTGYMGDPDRNEKQFRTEYEEAVRKVNASCAQALAGV